MREAKMADSSANGLAFSPQTKARIAELLTRYPRKQGALIPVLWLAQEEFGWLKPAVLELVAAELQLSKASVLATAMFYTMLYKRPHGRFHVQICTNVACYLRGSDDLVATAVEVLGINPGETSEDGLFTLQQVQCLCACERAPTLQVNKTDYFDVTPNQFRALLEQLQTDGLRLGPSIGWPGADESTNPPDASTGTEASYA
ncbi:MAG: NAD(P)H-dependent oxidoreductase subunit E [Myxococcales bacterium]|nr:NAD(P)H-dependent oxidoreductase subunit E [Myxococcales bacterium]